MNISVIIPAGKQTIVKNKNLLQDDIENIIERGDNPSQNRNKGIKKAKGKLVAFINAHSSLDKKWKEAVISFFKRHPSIDIVGGPQLTSASEGVFGRATGYALMSSLGSGNVAVRYKKGKEILNADETMLTSANLICRKNVFKKVQFNETMYPGEDPQFIRDAKKAGFLVAYSPYIIVFNERRKSFSLLSYQMYRYGYMRRIIKLKDILFTVPSLFTIYLVTLPLFFLITPIILLPLIGYLLLTFAYTLFFLLKKRDVASLLLPLIYFCIHISYGVGFMRVRAK